MTVTKKKCSISEFKVQSFMRWDYLKICLNNPLKVFNYCFVNDLTVSKGSYDDVSYCYFSKCMYSHQKKFLATMNQQWFIDQQWNQLLLQIYIFQWKAG